MIFDMPEETGGGLISGLPLVSLYGCVASLWLHREHILDFLRVDYASVWE